LLNATGERLDSHKIAMEALELRVQQTEERIVFLQRENERLTNSEEDLLNQLCISDQQQNQHDV